MTYYLVAGQSSCERSFSLAIARHLTATVSSRNGQKQGCRVPRTTSEPVPSVSEAFLPTASVVPGAMSDCCSCGVREPASEGSLKGSSSPTDAMAMLIEE